MIDRVLNSLLRDVGSAWAKDGRVDQKKVIVLPVMGELTILGLCYVFDLASVFGYHDSRIVFSRF